MSGPGDRLGIEFISVLGLPPVAFVHLAADLGVGAIGLAAAPFTANPHGYPAWSLRDDARLRRELVAALTERQITVSLGEGFVLMPGGEVEGFAADLDLLAEIGCRRANILPVERDPARGVDGLGRFADLAAARGMAATVEFMPGALAGDFAAAVAMVDEVGRANLSVLVDCMHFARGGSDPAELAACDPAAIGYVQLCDAPASTGAMSYGEEAKHHRLPPGEGELPLAAILAALPAGVPIGLEVPQLSLAGRGVSPHDRLAPAVAAARALLTTAAARG